MTHVDNDLLATLAKLHAAEFRAATNMLAASGGTPILTAAQDAADNAVDHVLAAAVRVGTTDDNRIAELQGSLEASEHMRDTLRDRVDEREATIAELKAVRVVDLSLEDAQDIEHADEAYAEDSVGIPLHEVKRKLEEREPDEDHG